MAKDETKGESLNDAAVISAFKDKTKEKFHELDGMDPETIEANVKKIVQGIVNDYGMDVTIEDVVVSGSRCRGMEEKGADLDVVLYYSGSVREDDLFNTLNQGNIIMGGVKLDINTISQEQLPSPPCLGPEHNPARRDFWSPEARNSPRSCPWRIRPYWSFRA